MICVIWLYIEGTNHDKKDKIFIFVEQHVDGAWWFHPRTGYYNSEKKAKRGFKKHFWWDLKRPYKIIELKKQFPIKENNYSWFSKDLKQFQQDFTDILWNI